MIHLVAIILCFLNFLISHLKKNYRFIAFALLIFMWVLFWGNTMNPDYSNYVRLYKDIQSGLLIFGDGIRMEFGFKFLMKICVIYIFAIILASLLNQ